MTKESRKRCVFCGAPEVSDEHVWPQWIERFLNSEILPGIDFDKQRFETDPQTFQSRQIGKVWGGPQLDIKVKCVCKRCNNRWMSDVENAAIPFLKPMIRGDRIDLDRKAREIVATWAFLRVVMADYTDSGQKPVPDSHRRWLFKEHKPPRHGVYVWLAGSSGDETAGFYQQVPLATHQAQGSGYRPGLMNAYGATFSILKLVFQVFGATTAARGSDLRYTGPVARTTQRIWPLEGQESLLLPKPDRFDETSLRQFANSFVPAE